MPKINQRGLDIIKQFEGFSEKPYLCPAGKWTIGYGTTRLPNGNPVRKNTPQITVQQAEEYLRSDIVRFEEGLAKLVKVAVNANQWSALVSLVYNIGLGIKDGKRGDFADSTLLAYLNQGQYKEAAKEFPRWVWANGVKLKGLVRRRNAEMELFLAK